LPDEARAAERAVERRQLAFRDEANLIAATLGRWAVYLPLHLAYDAWIVDKRSAAERYDFPMET
jgi:hypothetical protein